MLPEVKQFIAATKNDLQIQLNKAIVNDEISTLKVTDEYPNTTFKIGVSQQLSTNTQYALKALKAEYESNPDAEANFLQIGNKAAKYNVISAKDTTEFIRTMGKRIGSIGTYPPAVFFVEVRTATEKYVPTTTVPACLLEGIFEEKKAGSKKGKRKAEVKASTELVELVEELVEEEAI